MTNRLDLTHMTSAADIVTRARAMGTDTNVAKPAWGTPKFAPYMDARSLIDDSSCSDKIWQPECSSESFISDLCKSYQGNVPNALLSIGVMEDVRDFQQGGRTVARFRELAQFLGHGAPVPGSFFATDVSGGAGTDWMVGAWSLDPNFWSLGAYIVFSRSVLTTQDVLINLTNDPTQKGPGGVVTPLPPISLGRGAPLIRGRNGSTLQFRCTDASFAVKLPWFYRAATNMDTGQVDIGVATPVPIALPAFAYFGALNPACPIGAVGFSFLVRSSVPLSGVRLQPLANNNTAMTDAGLFVL